MKMHFVRLMAGRYVRVDQVAAIVEDGRGWATITLLSGAQIGAPELTARKVLSAMERTVIKAAHAAREDDPEARP